MNRIKLLLMNTFCRILFFFIVSYQFGFAQAEYGMASYYADKYQGSKTANGEKYDRRQMTAAHRTLPFDTKIKVTNLDNQRSVIVRINDRGPFVKGNIVDLSRVAAEKLDIIQVGIQKIKLEVVTEETIPAPAPIVIEEKPAPLVINAPTTISKPAPKPALGKGVTKPTLGKGSNLFQINVQEISKAAYGVQIASYAQYENILRQIADLKGDWSRNAMVYVSRNNNAPVYKLILGPFTERATANSYLQQVKNQKMEGFVVDLSKL